MQKDIHPESMSDAGNATPDFAGADDPQRLSMQIESKQTFQGEIALANAVVGFVDFPVDRKQQGKRMFCYCVRRIRRDANHW
jgi:hypothetical protein